MQKKIFYYLFLPLIIFLIFFNKPIEEPIKLKTHSGNLIKVKNKIFVPSPQKNKSYQLLEFNQKKNTLDDKGREINGQYIGHTIKEEHLYLANYNSIALYQIDKSGNFNNLIKYLPTPKCDFIASCFQKNNIVTLTTFSSKMIEVVSWTNDAWTVVNTITLSENQSPKGIIYVLNNDDKYIGIWESENSIFLVDIYQKNPTIKKIPDQDLVNFVPWKSESGIHISGFRKDSFVLETFNLKGLFQNNQTLSKVNQSNFPTFKYPNKIISLVPVVTNNQLNGFFFGTAFDVPIYITKESSLTQKKLDVLIYQEINDKALEFLFSLMCVLIILIYLTNKFTNVWEDKIVTLKIPEKAIFFGPTIHRGFAYLIDSLILTLTILVITYLTPQYINISTILNMVLSGNTLEGFMENINTFLKIQFIVFLYFTLFDYFNAGSIGKISTGLKILSNKNLQKINILQAISRNLLPKVFSEFIFVLISNILITITKKKRSLNDYLGNTVVVYSRLHKKLNLKIEINEDDQEESDKS
ncbi:MAG: hypothetical protein COA79_00900 [Planctomycetota bacterium]|nr:MAG: hypothetical protein COA79_00900 [Planctomycetota bacterium]